MVFSLEAALWAIASTPIAPPLITATSLFFNSLAILWVIKFVYFEGFLVPTMETFLFFRSSKSPL
jgi:hypothetical protein